MNGPGFSPLAQAYAAGRIGYSTELYEAIFSFGSASGRAVLDLACGTGLASEPFAAGGFNVTGVDLSPEMIEKARERLPSAEFVIAPAEKLPFPDARFDVALCAQAFHWFDRSRAMRELLRVLKPGGTLAIWWKHLMSDDPVKVIRDDVARELGASNPPCGLSGGFREFYAAGLAPSALRVLPWRVAMPLERFLDYERSRCNLRLALGERSQEYFERLRERLQERFGAANPSLALGYMQYLYLGKAP